MPASASPLAKAGQTNPKAPGFMPVGLFAFAAFHSAAKKCHCEAEGRGNLNNKIVNRK
jgi:hypothetical protein